MAVRLQLEDGIIKEYRTWYSIYYGQGEGKPDAYGTKCGIRWNKEPSRLEGCSHIDCALRAKGSGILSGVIIALFFTGFAAYGLYIMLQEGEYAWIIMLIPGIASIAFSYSILTYSWKNQKIIDKLHEFRDHGAIHGIKAQIIGGDSILNKSSAIQKEADNIKLPKPTLLDVFFPIFFLALGVIWFSSTLVIMTDIGGLMGQRFESPIPYYLHPVAWAFAVIGWIFMRINNNPKAQEK